jgi:hypothetical protein
MGEWGPVELRHAAAAAARSGSVGLVLRLALCNKHTLIKIKGAGSCLGVSSEERARARDRTRPEQHAFSTLIND